MRKIILFLFTIILFSIPVFSEVITLKSKEMTWGKIKGYSSANNYILVNQDGESKRYYLSDINTIDGIDVKNWIRNQDERDYALLSFLLILMVGGIHFYTLFIAEAVPGIGWYSFSVSNISFGARLILFLIYLTGAAISLKDRFLGWIIVSFGFIFLISSTDDFD